VSRTLYSQRRSARLKAALPLAFTLGVGACSRIEAPSAPESHDGSMNASPRAIAHYGGVYSVGHEVVLDGSMSFDVDGEVQSYAWAMVSAPLGAEDFENSNSATHSYNLHAIGDYVFQLTVTDDDGATNIGLVEVQALVHDPILLRIDGTKRVKLGQPIPLVASLEPGDATNLSLSWSVVGQPAGAGVFIEGVRCDRKIGPHQAGEFCHIERTEHEQEEIHGRANYWVLEGRGIGTARC